jgi:opacity protein-like surface antigen
LAARETRCCLLLGVNGEWRGQDRFGGAIEEDSGGNTVYLAPGLQFAFTSHWVLDLTYQQAVYHHLNGTQLVETQKIAGGLAYRF